jgi:3-oxoacyl-[acyl-carrier-protein] synthase-1
VTPRIKIVGVAARTPVGLVAETTAAAIRAGICRVREHPFLVDAMGEPLPCGMDARLDPYQVGPARMAALASASFEEICVKLGPAPVAGAPLILVLPETRPGLDQDEEFELLQRVRSFIGTFRLEVGPRGHAGSLAALARAHDLLGAGAPLVVVLAVDSYLDPETLRWLDASRRLRGSVVRGAFSPGEASAALALVASPPRHPQPRGMAIVSGIGVASERRSNDDEGVLGEGLTEALRRAAAGLHLPDEAVDDLYGDINGERQRSDDWGFSQLRFPGLARRPTDYHLFTDLCGDVGAATGALSCVLAVRAWERGYSAGPRALVWAGSDTGLRAAAILRQGEG